METIYGRRPVREALTGTRRIHNIQIAQTARKSEVLAEIVELARAKNVPVSAVRPAELDAKLGDAAHQGVTARVDDFAYSDIADLLDAVNEKPESLVVALDQVTDVQNLGAVIRTAAAAGADAVMVGKRRTAPVTPAVVKSSAGMTEKIMVVSANLSVSLERLKEASFWVVGADAAGRERVWDLNLTGRLVVVLGSEGRGLSRLVAERCDWLASLPLAPGVDSLNVSAAAAAFLFEAVRQKACRT